MAGASALRSTARHGGPPGQLRVAAGSVGAAVLGVAPHVLHHAGPLAGAALVAGAGGTLLFGALGLVAAIPMLRRLHRRTGSWASPGAALALFASVFALSSFVIGPALTDSDARDATRAPGQSAPRGQTTPGETATHEEHHP